MTLQVEIKDLRRMLKEKCEEIISDKKLAYEFYCRICEIEEDDRFRIIDGLTLLKEQEAVEPKRKDIAHNDIDWFCGKCGACVRRLDNYCSRCGRKVKWE